MRTQRASQRRRQCEDRAESCSHKPRNADSHWKLEEARKDPSPEPPKEVQSGQHPDFGLLASRIHSVGQATQFVVLIKAATGNKYRDLRHVSYSSMKLACGVRTQLGLVSSLPHWSHPLQESPRRKNILRLKTSPQSN